MNKSAKNKIEYFHVSILGLSDELELRDVLSIGKIGQDLNCNHPQISLKHCTLYYADSVLSIKDHSSETGVYISDKKIPQEQMIIILEDDQVKLGDLILSVKPVYGKLLEDLAVDDIGEPNDLMPPPLPDILATNIDHSEETSDFVPFPVKKTEVEDIFDISISELKNASKVVDLSKKRGGEALDEAEVIFTEGSFLDDSLIHSEKESTESLTQEDGTFTQVKISNESDDFELSEKSENIDDSVSDETLGAYTQVNMIPSVDKKAKEKVNESDYGVIFPLRLLALFIDINLSVILCSLFSTSSIFHSIKSLSSALVKYIPIIPKSFNALLAYLLFFFILRIIANLFLAKSFGQLVCFILVQKNQRSRLRAIGRSIFSLITFPISFLFDLPALVSKATLKEKIFGSRLYSSSTMISFLSGGLVFFITTYLAFIFPRPEVEPQTVNIDEKVYQVPSTSIVQDKVSSSYFHFFKPYKKKSFLSYPFFKIKKEQGKKTFIPIMQVYSVSNKSFVQLSNLNYFSWKSVLERFEEKNPLFSIQYESVFNAFNAEKFDKSLFVSEFISLLKASFTVDSKDQMGHLLNFGPFSNSYLELKKVIEYELEGKVKKLEFIKLGKKLFAHFLIEPAKFSDQKSISVLWGISIKKSVRFKLTSDDKLKMTMFHRNFFEGINWSQNDFLELKSKIDPYQIIDYFTKYDKTQVSLGDLERIYRYYFRLGKWLVNNESKRVIRKDFLDKARSMLSLVIGLNIIERKKKESQSDYHPLEETVYEGFIKNFTSLLEAIKVKDMSFFES